MTSHELDIFESQTTTPNEKLQQSSGVSFNSIAKARTCCFNAALLFM